MIKFNIESRWSSEVKFTAEIDCDESATRSIKVGLAVKWAIKNKTNLRGANLRGANLWEANLRGASLRGASLWGANLRGANLWEANLREANLRGANLRGANLREADLREADLRGASLRGANLRGANLRGANLRGAKGFITFGPIGKERRMGAISIKDNKPLVTLGCFTGTEKEAIDAINKKYGRRSSYAQVVRAMCAECRTLIKSLPAETKEKDAT